MPRDTPPSRARRIGELADELGLSTRTLRYWEERSLIPAADRSRCGYRLYDDEHVRAARGVERLKASGLSLDDIATLARVLGSSGTALGGVEGVRGELQSRIEALERSIELQQELVRELRSSLGRLAHCNGCDGKPYDGSCIRCLDACEEHIDLPLILNSLLHAALKASARSEPR